MGKIYLFFVLYISSLINGRSLRKVTLLYGIQGRLFSFYLPAPSPVFFRIRSTPLFEKRIQPAPHFIASGLKVYLYVLQDWAWPLHFRSMLFTYAKAWAVFKPARSRWGPDPELAQSFQVFN